MRYESYGHTKNYFYRWPVDVGPRTTQLTLVHSIKSPTTYLSIIYIYNYCDLDTSCGGSPLGDVKPETPGLKVWLLIHVKNIRLRLVNHLASDVGQPLTYQVYLIICMEMDCTLLIVNLKKTLALESNPSNTTRRMSNSFICWEESCSTF